MRRARRLVQVSFVSIGGFIACGQPARPEPAQPIAPSPAVVAPTPPPPAPDAVAPTADEGARLFEAKGCIACHTVDGTPKIGPPLNGYFGRELKLADGTPVVGSEARFRASLDAPEPLDGFAPTMPTYGEMVDDHARAALIVYVKSLP